MSADWFPGTLGTHYAGRPLTSVAAVYPAWAKGFIAIEIVSESVRPPSLRHAIGSRIYWTRRGAEAMAHKAKQSLGDAGRGIKVVPVDGPNGVFALDYIDVGDCLVRPDGSIRVRA